MGYGTLKIDITTTLESSFSGDSRAIRDYQWFRNLFGRDEKIVLLIRSDNIFSPEFLARLKQFHEDLESTIPLLSEVNSICNAPYIVKKDDGLQVRSFLDILPQTEDEAAALKDKALSRPAYMNSYISEKGDAMIVVIKTRAVSALTEDGRRIKNRGRGIGEKKGVHAEGLHGRSISQVENIAVIGIVEAVIKQYNADDFRIVFSGTPVYQFHVEPKIRKNVKRFSIMVLALTFFFMATLFRRVSGIFLPQFVVIMGLACTMGLMGITGVPFTLTSSHLPTIILSVGLMAPIHFMVVFFRFQCRIGRIRAIIATLGHSGLPILMTSLTTIVGLLSFTYTDIAPVAFLGIFAATGITFCLFFTLIFLPAILSILKVLPGKEREQLYEASLYNRLLRGLGSAGIRKSRAVCLLFLCATIIFIPGVVGINLSHNMLHYFDDDSGFMIGTRLIERETGGFRALEVVADTGGKDGITDAGFLDSVKALESFVAQKDKAGVVYAGKTFSIADVIREVNQAWHYNDPDYYRIPDDDALVKRRLSELVKSGAGYLETVADADLSLARFTAMMFWKDAAEDVAFVKRLETFAAEKFEKGTRVVVTGAVAIGAKVIGSMMSGLATGYVLAFLIITLFMIAAIGELRLGLLAMVPNIFPIIAGLGLMGYLDIPLNTYNLIGASIVIGVVVDDTIHFFHNFRKYYLQSGNTEYAVMETLNSAGRALISTSLILVSCFWIHLTSPLKVIGDFGLVVGFSLLLAFLADVILAPALLNIYYSTRKHRPKRNVSVAATEA